MYVSPEDPPLSIGFDDQERAEGIPQRCERGPHVVGDGVRRDS